MKKPVPESTTLQPLVSALIAQDQPRAMTALLLHWKATGATLKKVKRSLPGQARVYFDKLVPRCF